MTLQQQQQKKLKSYPLTHTKRGAGAKTHFLSNLSNSTSSQSSITLPYQRSGFHPQVLRPMCVTVPSSQRSFSSARNRDALTLTFPRIWERKRQGSECVSDPLHPTCLPPLRVPRHSAGGGGQATAVVVQVRLW